MDVKCIRYIFEKLSESILPSFHSINKLAIVFEVEIFLVTQAELSVVKVRCRFCKLAERILETRLRTIIIVLLLNISMELYIWNVYVSSYYSDIWAIRIHAIDSSEITGYICLYILIITYVRT